MSAFKLLNSLKLLIVTAICTTIFFTSCTNKEEHNFKDMDMTGANQAPPIDTKGSGTLKGEYNQKTKEIKLDLKWSLGNPDDKTTAGHIHKGAMGVSGPVVIPFENLPDGSKDQKFKFTSRPLTAEEEADLMAGNYYVNIHSTTFPDGELRAQLEMK